MTYLMDMFHLLDATDFVTGGGWMAIKPALNSPVPIVFIDRDFRSISTLAIPPGNPYNLVDLL